MEFTIPLFNAIQAENSAQIKALINEGANVHRKDENNHGIFPLYYAVQIANATIVKLLIEKKGNVHAKCQLYSSTALALAIKNNDTEIINLLQQAGATMPPEPEEIIG